MENLVLIPLLADNQSYSCLPDPNINSLSLFTQTITFKDLNSHMDSCYGTFLTFCGAFSVHTPLNCHFWVNFSQYVTSRLYIGDIHPSLHLIRSSYGITTMCLRRSSSSTTNVQSWNWLKERLKTTTKPPPTMFLWPFSNLFFNYSHEQKPNRAKDYEGEKKEK